MDFVFGLSLSVVVHPQLYVQTCRSQPIRIWLEITQNETDTKGPQTSTHRYNTGVYLSIYYEGHF